MKVLVIGGGPAGMMAAGRAASRGAQVRLLEKNDKLGKKLRITGKGRCNITNDCAPEELLRNVVSNPSFLYSAFHGFSNTDLIAFMESLGVPTKVERGGRVFPVSDKAHDVADAMRRYMQENGVRVLKGEADKIITQDGTVCGVRLRGGRQIEADAVVLATGGLGYPITGSTGDGYKMAQALGHTIVPLRPSLVPLVCRENEDLMGLSLKNIGFRVLQGEQTVYEDFGELLFTHYGISGPVVLSASAHMRKSGVYTAEIDLKPALTEQALDKRLLRDFEKYGKRDYINALDDLLPKRLIKTIVARTGIDPRKKVDTFTKEERLSLAAALKHFTLTVTGFRPLAEAIVTAGGVKTAEVNPKTMESKLIHGLYFAGELLDVDAYTGGFNLQIAFSTGYAAGNNIEGDGINEW